MIAKGIVLFGSLVSSPTNTINNSLLNDNYNEPMPIEGTINNSNLGVR